MILITNLLTNMVIVGFSGCLTNTASLDQFVLHEMFTNAQAMASAWHLDQKLIATNRVTHFEVRPQVESYSASITFGGRYEFGGDARGIAFVDRRDCSASAFSSTNSDFVIHYNLAHKEQDPKNSPVGRLAVVAQEGDWKRLRATAERLTPASKNLTLNRARDIAEWASRVSGFPMKSGGLRGSPKGQQMIWQDEEAYHFWVPPEALGTNEARTIRNVPGLPKDHPEPSSIIGPYDNGQYCISFPQEHSKQYALPFYEFHWESRRATCDIEVFGVTSNVVLFSYTGPGAGLQVPGNYSNLLGLPTNAVFVVRLPRPPNTFETYDEWLPKK
jgi:hypothetical protein